MASVRQSGEWIVSTRHHSTSISPDRRCVYTFDLEGRPLSWYDHDVVYKRALDSTIHARRRVAGTRRRWRVPAREAPKLYERMLRSVSSCPGEAFAGEGRGRLEAIARWTPTALLGERERFEAAYEPIGILPPDMYLGIVLQATFGCSWNRCTFCSFYQDRPFTARAAEEFRAHVTAVRALLGRGVELRRGIFLADGNALILSNDRLREVFEIAGEAFPSRRVHGFVDVFTGERKSVAEWRELQRLGLERVHLGLESGHAELLHWMNKPVGGVEGFVAGLKAAGLLVSVIFMVGAGGDRFAGAHVRDTTDLLARLPLGRGDIVYLSPFVATKGSEYARSALRDHVRPLDDAEAAQQYAALREAARAAHPEARVTAYDIREFLY